MKFLKPWKGGYMLVQGSGRVISFTEEQMKTMSMAYDELKLVSEEKSRRSFSLNSEPIEKLLEGVKDRRKVHGELYGY